MFERFKRPTMGARWQPWYQRRSVLNYALVMVLMAAGGLIAGFTMGRSYERAHVECKP